MSTTQLIVALATAIPTILGAVTALIIALRTNNKVNAHVAVLHSDTPNMGSQNRH